MGREKSGGFDFSESGLRRRWYRIAEGEKYPSASDASVRWAAAFESLDCLAKQVAFSNHSHRLVECFFDGFPRKSAEEMALAVIYPEPNKPVHVITNHSPYHGVKGIGKVWCSVEEDRQFPPAVMALCNGDNIEWLDKVPSFLREKTLDAMVAAAVSLGNAESVNEIVTFAHEYKGSSRLWVQESIEEFVNTVKNPKALTFYLDAIRSYSGRSLKQFAGLIQDAGECGLSDEGTYGSGHCMRAMKLMDKALTDQPPAVLTAIDSALAEGYGGSPDFCVFPRALDHPSVREKISSLKGAEVKGFIKALAWRALENTAKNPKAALRNAVQLARIYNFREDGWS